MLSLKLEVLLEHIQINKIKLYCIPHNSALGYRPPAPQTQVPKLLQNQPMLLQ